MKLNAKYTLAVAALLMGVTACDKNFEEFELQGSTQAPVAFNASSVHSEALPGQIKLNWTAPEGDYAYMQVRYYDPFQKKEVAHLFSKGGETELLVENTAARFGDYTFNFQTFNSRHEGSAVTPVLARSGVAPTTVSEERTKVSLTADQLSTDNQEPTEGPIANLLDGKVSFFHTRWSSPQKPMPQYIQVDFKEEHEDFAISYVTRDTWNTDGFPTLVDLQISSDGQEWTTVRTLNDLPTTRITRYTSTFVQPGQKFKYFRFLVKESSQNKNYFHMDEFAFYDTVVTVYDPETVPLD